MMQSLIRREFKSRTVIAIAHHLKTLVDYDKIAVLDEGQLIEFGSPAVLLGRHDSQFTRLLTTGQDTTV